MSDYHYDRQADINGGIGFLIFVFGAFFTLCGLCILMAIGTAIMEAFTPAVAEEPVSPPALQIEIDYENDVDLPVEETEETDSGDSELFFVRAANTIDRLTGWSDLSMDEQAVRVKLAGLIIEEVGKAIPKNPITGGFWHSAFRQCGVQMQIQAMYHLDELSHDPYISAAQGFLVGL